EYIITERIHLKGCMDNDSCSQITQAVSLLQSINQAPHTPEDLKDFIARFSAKYDREAVPLLQVLDPEIGIGYGNLETVATSNNLVAELAGNRLNNNPEKDRNQIKEFLAKQFRQSQTNSP